MRILAFGTYQAADHPRIAVLRTGLEATGHHVREANVPLGLSTRDRVAMLGSSGGALKMAARLLPAWWRMTTRALPAKRRGGPDALLVGYMGHFDVWLARILFPRTTIVLDHLVFAATTATDRGVGDRGLKHRLLRFLDRAALTIADIVVLDTEEHRDLVPASLQHKAVVVPVGATERWFDAGTWTDNAAPDDALRVVFFGLFTPLQGAATIGAAIGRLPADGDIRVTMIGSGQDFDAAQVAAQGGAPTEWISWVDSAELPDVVARHDVGIGIVGTTDKAQRVVPNKVYQCAAAGTAVVTSDTPPQRRAFGDGVDYVPAGDPQALADALVAFAEDRGRLADRKRAARAAAERFRPEAVVASLNEALAARATARSRS